MDATAADAAFGARLETLRERLLDLSARNKLLNFRPGASAVRIVDEVPGRLVARLLDGKSFRFDPVPDPMERELARWRAGLDPAEAARAVPDAATWARFLGRETAYDLPAGEGDLPRRHDDDRLQTLQFKAGLDATLKRIRRDARLAVEELGSNLLHLAVGFLQWRDAERRDYFAPLILLPVEIGSQTVGGEVVLRLSYTGEDLQPNLSLEKRLLDEFGVVLPDREDDEAPSDYFRRVREVLPAGRDWTVRPFATLALFQFGNLVLYRDLDPAMWAPGAAPADSALVQAIAFGAGPGPGETRPDPPAEEVDLRLPLIDRADSSQARALVRALSERSLVVQGPPGTGKSQTITNLVAAALARGETVLFVAEKLAALGWCSAASTPASATSCWSCTATRRASRRPSSPSSRGCGSGWTAFAGRSRVAADEPGEPMTASLRESIGA